MSSNPDQPSVDAALEDEMSGPVNYERRGLAGIVNLASTADRNAISLAMIGEVKAAVQRAYDDEDVRYVVLTHTGNTFCAGADLREQKGFGATPEHLQVRRGLELGDLFSLLLAGPKPVVGAVYGHVRAGGTGLVAACDVVFAGPEASFAMTEVRIGAAPTVTVAVLEERLTPRALAELSMRGNVIDAAEAQRVGLITRVVPDVDEALDSFAADLQAAGPSGLEAAKGLANRRVVDNVARRTPELAVLSARLFMAAEAQAGMRAFLRHEPAPWAPQD